MAINFDLTMPWAGMRRCNLRDNGTVAAYYGDSGFNYNGSNGQVMVEIPKFWFKKTVKTEGGDRKFEFAISDKPEPGFKVHPAFYRDRNGDGVAEEVDFRYYAAFEGFRNGSLLESKAGVASTVSQTIATFRNQAQARGTGWGITDFNLLSAVQMLYLVEYGHFDSQTKIGKGISSGSKQQTGQTTSLGNTTGQGSGADGNRAMTYRGIENWYGNIRDWIDGCRYESNTVLIGNVGFNDNGTGYKSYSFVNPGTGGHITDIQDNGDLGFIPKAFASSSTYDSHLYDYGYVDSGRLPSFGGHWSLGAYAGAFCLASHSPSYSYSSLGARLAF